MVSGCDSSGELSMLKRTPSPLLIPLSMCEPHWHMKREDNVLFVNPGGCVPAGPHPGLLSFRSAGAFDLVRGGVRGGPNMDLKDIKDKNLMNSGLEISGGK